MHSNNCENIENNIINCKRENRGGKRAFAGRKRTCAKKISFNRRINQDILNILREYANNYSITDTEALESAILLQSNIDKLKGDKIMKIAIPSKNDKLCTHFGHCDSFTFLEINPESKEIMNKESRIPDEGISCQSASWLASQGINVVIAGGMGEKPLQIFAQNGVKVVTGCSELPIDQIVNDYLNNSLNVGKNSCIGDEHHHCHNHENHGHCNEHQHKHSHKHSC